MKPDYKYYFVFDIESIGLHGEGFAVGLVVIDKDGNEVESAVYACPPEAAKGTDENRKWISENVPELEATHMLPKGIRAAFWDKWMEYSAQGAVMFADCAWPVEARFLVGCVNDSPESREWEGPYPLHDIASIFLAKGQDPKGTYDRLENEMPAHHPLGDARQSARLLIEALSGSTLKKAA